jgi:ribosomal protein S16
LTKSKYGARDPYLEDLGSFDPMPNRDNQMLVALNVERIQYYMSKSVPVKGNAAVLMGKTKIDYLKKKKSCYCHDQAHLSCY